MQDGIELFFLEISPSVIVVEKAPFNANHTLAFSNRSPICLKGLGWDAIIRYHDAADVFLMDVEIRNRANKDFEVRIPFKTHLPDLFLCYQWLGRSRLLKNRMHRYPGLLLKEKQQVQVYSEPTSGIWQLSGAHVLFTTLVVRGTWAGRYGANQNPLLEKLIRWRRNEVPHTFYTGPVSLDKVTSTFLNRLFSLPKQQGMGLDGEIQTPVGKAMDELRGINGNLDSPFVMEVKEKVICWLEQEPPLIPSIGKLAESYFIGEHAFWQRYEKGRGEGTPSLLKFIITAKLEKSIYLMTEKGWTIGETAAYLRYAEHSVFSHQFKQVYGLSPSEYLRNFWLISGKK